MFRVEVVDAVGAGSRRLAILPEGVPGGRNGGEWAGELVEQVRVRSPQAQGYGALPRVGDDPGGEVAGARFANAVRCPDDRVEEARQLAVAPEAVLKRGAEVLRFQRGAVREKDAGGHGETVRP